MKSLSITASEDARLQAIDWKIDWRKVRLQHSMFDDEQSVPFSLMFVLIRSHPQAWWWAGHGTTTLIREGSPGCIELWLCKSGRFGVHFADRSGHYWVYEAREEDAREVSTCGGTDMSLLANCAVLPEAAITAVEQFYLTGERAPSLRWEPETGAVLDSEDVFEESG